MLRAADALARRAPAVEAGASLTLDKSLPVASGIGGGSADAAAALRLLTRLWRIDPAHATAVAPTLGADVPACLLSMTARGDGAGDALELVDAGDGGNAGVAGQSAACLVDRRRCSRRGTGSIAGRSGIGATGATTSKRRRDRWSRRSATCSTGCGEQRRRELRAHVGKRGDLLRLVRRRGGARRGGGGLSRDMVASGELPALRRAHHDPTDPYRRRDARCRASRDRCGHAGATLIERAGAALAEAVRRFVGPRDTLILCGPGNNGADGQVAARHLAEAGYAVRIATLDDLGRDAEPAPILIDCLFGTGLNRGLEDAVSTSFCDWRGSVRDHRLRPAERRVERRRRLAVAGAARRSDASRSARSSPRIG